tara:strand:- start:1104 stop:1286 length:183 start_codon:yes stop_codon:yes gene_type:complete
VVLAITQKKGTQLLVIGGIELFKDFFVSFLEGIQYKYVSTLLQKEVVFLKKEQKHKFFVL